MAEYPGGGAVTEHPAGGPAHPAVSYERRDVAPRGIVIFAVSLVVGLVIVMGGLVGLFDLLLDLQRSRKQTDLPPAAVDENPQRPEPLLEGIEDVKNGQFAFWPARAKRVLKPEERQLEQGDPRKQTLPIDRAVRDVLGSGLLRARETDAEPPPNALRRLPSKAASGRTFTGGQ
jgi:hypothetical protein